MADPAPRLTGGARTLLAALLAALAAAPATPLAADGRGEIGGRLSTTFAARTAEPGGPGLRDVLCDLEGRYEWKNGWKIRALGRARFEDRLEPEPSRELTLRELVLSRRGRSYTLRLGRQQVVWGKADGLRLLDLVNPLDLREFILDDYTDRRIPLWMVNAELYLGDDALQLLVIPDLTFDRQAAPGGEFFPAPALAAAPLPATVRRLEKPGEGPENWEYGLRWSTRVGRLDLTFHAFSGWNNFAAPASEISATGLELTPLPTRLRLVGASGDLPLGAAVLRFEATYTPDEPLEIRVDGAPVAYRRQRVWRHVLGLDWIRRNWLLSPQWIEQKVFRADPRRVGETRQTYLSLLVRRAFRQDRLTFQAFYARGLDGGDAWLSPRLAYRFFGRLELALGADLLGGPPDGFFGRYAGRDRLTFETTWRF